MKLSAWIVAQSLAQMALVACPIVLGSATARGGIHAGSGRFALIIGAAVAWAMAGYIMGLGTGMRVSR